ncbi:B12-binding domain-containing radical SAM protein [Nocardia sp. CA-084685]|uniref:B12-binding domain-containing radical SAM protein n=1 Tax=Nocardia sp. CA-084685 TaxID=3239970 RepID=UPI003D95918D
MSVNARNFHLPPYGVWALKAFVDHYSDEHGLEVEVKVISLSAEISVDNILECLRVESPNLIGLSHYIWNDGVTLALAGVLKSELPEAAVIMGGPHTDSNDMRLTGLVSAGKVDALVIGEGERPLLAILEDLSRGQDIQPSTGVYCMPHAAGQVKLQRQIFTPRDSLDYLPNPYLVCPELLEQSIAAGSVQYQTSRGCPFSCTFCDQGHQAYRTLSDERIRKDIELFASRATSHIDFLDGTFNLKPSRTEFVLEKLISAEQPWTFHAEIKPDHLTDPEMDLLTIAGCESVELGLQTIHQSTQRAIKRRNNLEKFRSVVESLLRRDIQVVVDTIVALPNETLSDWLETVDFCSSLGDVVIQSNLLKLLPNTVLLAQQQEFGYSYDLDLYNAVTESNRMNGDDIRTAVVLTKLIDIYWNSQLRARTRRIMEERFEGRLSGVLRTVLEAISDSPGLVAGGNFVDESFRLLESPATVARIGMP